MGLTLTAVFNYFGSLRQKLAEPQTESGSSLPKPNRIICAVPNITEIVFALGQGERVIGVSDFSTYPPEAHSKESIGGYIDPNLERIITLKPDLVILIGVNNRLIALCQEKGIEWLRVEIENLQTLFQGIQTIAAKLHCSGKGTQLVNAMKQGLERIRQRALRQPFQPNVFLCISRMEGQLTDLFTVSDQAFLGELMTLTGGKNIFGELGSRYPQIAKESLMKREPGVIIELRPEDALNTRSLKDIQKDWEEISSTPAVAAGRVHIVTDDYIKIAGPRIVQTAERLYQLIHEQNKP